MNFELAKGHPLLVPKFKKNWQDLKLKVKLGLESICWLKNLTKENKMQVVWHAPTQFLIDGKLIEKGATYTIHAISFSNTLRSGLVELVEFPDKDTKKFHRFKADHLRALNGKSTDKVQALPDTRAFGLYGKRTLQLAGLKHRKKDGAELVLLAPSLNPKPMPYAEFEHVWLCRLATPHPRQALCVLRWGFVLLILGVG